MLLPILLTLASLTQAPGEPIPMPAVAPVVSDQVTAILKLNLNDLDVTMFARRILGKVADDAGVVDLTRMAAMIGDQLKKAGAGEVYVLVDLADMPGYPVVVVPRSGSEKTKAITDILMGDPLKFPACEAVPGFIVAGKATALARIKSMGREARPDLAASLAAVGKAPVGLVIVPGVTLRRSVEESMPALPPELGKAPITTLTRGLAWVSMAMASDPSPTIKVVIKGRDNAAATAIVGPLKKAIEMMARAVASDPTLAPLGAEVAKLRPEVVGDAITLEADLEKAAALVSVPVRSAQEGARRSESVNNLKQIGLALHNYHSAKNTFPPAYVASKDGKPLLSWRVLILPYIDQKELFDEFHLDEAWDSPHNKALLPRMPLTYASPFTAPELTKAYKTTYLAPRAVNSLFPGAVGIKIQEITDGTSNTIMALAASDESAVVWTKPDDWMVTPEINFKTLFGQQPKGTSILLGDGAVRFLKETVTPKILQALLTRNGGEVIGRDDY